MRVVVDTNIIVSAYLGDNLQTVISALIKNEFTLIVSKAIVDEYFNVLKRPNFQIEARELDDLAALIVSKAEFVNPTEKLNIIDVDPTDNRFLEAAIEGKAIYIVSGDNHLLKLQSFRGVSIITAQDFIEKLNP